MTKVDRPRAGGRRVVVMIAATALIAQASARPASAWDEEGHIIVTRLAVKSLPADMPDWLRTPDVQYRLEYLSTEPDRWRGQDSVVLDHINKPDHYIDIEELSSFNLSLGRLPLFRREFQDKLERMRVAHAERFEVRRINQDKDYTFYTPGSLPYAISEGLWKLSSSWTTLKTYEQYRDLVTDAMIENARQNIVHEMGLLSHFVGDAAQPLHTTMHHNGWTGLNPKGYTTDRSFHRLIDGGLIAKFEITRESMVNTARPARSVAPSNSWKEILKYIHETHRLVVPLYELEKSKELYETPGKLFIEDRLLEGGAMLAGLWNTACDGAVIDDYRVRQLQENAKKAQGQPVAGAAGSRK